MVWRAAQGAEKASSIRRQGRGGAMPERTIQHCFYFARFIPAGHVFVRNKFIFL